MEKLGVENIKQATSAVAKLGVASHNILEDGKVNLADIPHLPSVLSGLKDISEVEFGQLLPELKDLDDTERAELSAHFKKEFELEDDTTEKLIEQGYDLLLMGLQAIMNFVTIGKKVKKVAA